jgi:hypothetical protein
MEADELVVARQAHVALPPIGAIAESVLIRGERVLGDLLRRASMGDNQGALHSARR